MSIISGQSFGRLPTRKPNDPALIRATRFACPRCATVNCTRHSAGMLTSQRVPAQWRGM